jgi:hypothetical protein
MLNSLIFTEKTGFTVVLGTKNISDMNNDGSLTCIDQLQITRFKPRNLVWYRSQSRPADL